MEENVNMFMSAEITELASALCEFQTSFEQPKLEKTVKVISKSGKNYTFKYADLSACVKAAAPALKANGLLLTQIINRNILVTLLLHKSGQWIKSELQLPQLTADYQAYGSAITYLKRYSYCSLLGIVADTDDDANIAVGNHAEIRDNNTHKAVVTRELLQQALFELEGIKSEADFKKLWDKWSHEAPAMCVADSEFYKAAGNKIAQIRSSK